MRALAHSKSGDYTLTATCRSGGEKLDDIVKVRERPGMYAGDIHDGTALHNLVLGTVTFAVARSRLHQSFSTKVVLRPDDAVTVCFAGSEDWDEAYLASFADARRKAATSIVDCIQLGPDALDVAGGVHCDLCVVNALSDWMCDQAWSGALIRTQMFRDGAFESTIEAPLFPEVIFDGQSGFSTTFLPTNEIFPSINFDVERLQVSLSDLCVQNVEGRVTLVDSR